MALAIDTAHLARHEIPRMQRELDDTAEGVRRFQVHRVSALATPVFLDPALQRAFLDGGSNYILLPKRNALNWEADPDDDVHELEVLHHLHQMAATAPVFSNQKDHMINDAITLVASAVSPSFSTMTHGRLPSSFRRYSLRLSEVCHPRYYMTSEEAEGGIDGIGRSSELCRLGVLGNTLDVLLLDRGLKIVWDRCRRKDRYVFWQVQVDVIDLLSRTPHPCSRHGKRRRTAFNPFLQVSDAPLVEATSRQNHLPQTEKFHGVRYRNRDKRWVAVMTPPNLKKQEFGYFKSEAQAACAVDAAFHHYGKPHLLNFPDTSPTILSTRPPAPAGLDATAKLRFVKQEAKWLASMAPHSPLLPSGRPNSLPFQCPQPSTSCTALPSGRFRSFSEISWPVSCVGPDEADDAVSGPQPWTQLHPFSDMAVVAVQPNSGRSSVEITEVAWDGAEECEILATPPNVVSPRACEMQSMMWLNSVNWSPPAPMNSMAPSPSHSEDDLVLALLGQSRF